MSKANKGQVRSKPPEMVAAAALAELSGHSPPTSSDDDEHEELHVCESSLAQTKYEKGNTTTLRVCILSIDIFLPGGGLFVC